MAVVKGYSWNCGGLRSSSPLSRSKTIYFEKEFGNTFDFFFFLETHHHNEEEIPKDILKYDSTHHIIQSPALGDETHAGILGLISKNYDTISNKDVIQGRLTNIKIRHKTETTEYNITAVYMDTNNHITKDKMQNVVRKLRLEYEEHANIIILGDFNFIDHEKDFKKWTK